MSYDRWLEKPYQDRGDESEAFEAWCDNEGIDAWGDDAWDRFKDAHEAEYEAALERRAEERAERDWDDRFDAATGWD